MSRSFAGQTVTLPSGDQVTLNADGTLTVQADTDVDTFHFTYDVQSSTGLIDTGMVTINSIPCFVAGTLIRTPSGDVPVESLTPGDLVMTHDDGAQPLRWIGRRSVPATGAFAPVRIRAGTFGPHGALMLSPQHRVLMRDSRRNCSLARPRCWSRPRIWSTAARSGLSRAGWSITSICCSTAIR